MKCNDCGEKRKLKPILCGNVYIWECLNCGSPDIVIDKKTIR